MEINKPSSRISFLGSVDIFGTNVSFFTFFFIKAAIGQCVCVCAVMRDTHILQVVMATN